MATWVWPDGPHASTYPPSQPTVPLSRGRGRQGPRNVCYPPLPAWLARGRPSCVSAQTLPGAGVLGTRFSQRSCRETWVLCLRSCPVLKGRARMRSLCSRLLLSTESRLLSQTDPLPQAQGSPALPSVICPQSWGAAPRKPGSHAGSAAPSGGSGSENARRGLHVVGNMVLRPRLCPSCPRGCRSTGGSSYCLCLRSSVRLGRGKGRCCVPTTMTFFSA